MRTQADSKTQGSNLTPGFEAGFDDPGFETKVPESIPSNSQKGELKMKFKAMILGMLTILGVCSTAFAQQTGYSQTNLVANTAGVANHTDAQLSNPWGISFIPGQPFWIANNNGGTSTLYDAQGNKQSLVVGIPSASMNPCNPGCPTGTVANSWS